jgi:diaminopimelate decarboxylase
LPIADAAELLRRARRLGLLDRAAVFHDLDRMRARLDALREAFPPSALHAVAIKANPLIEVLHEVVRAGGALEAASSEEIELALAAGCPPDRIVYDSPVKTRADLDRALTLGAVINADGFDELERIGSLWPAFANRLAQRTIGLRINPGVADGRIAATSVGSVRSRFGVAVDDGERIVDAFRRHVWLNALHCHVGSQGCSLEALVEAAAKTAALRRLVNDALGENRITTVDIGGGLPAAYRATDSTIDFPDYAAALRRGAPTLFEPRVRLITEMGRSVHAPCGFAASRVEYVHERDGSRFATTHLGADLFLRAAYAPHDWHHDVVVLDADGVEKSDAAAEACNVAGPLCFGGDVIARDRMLAPVAAGDWVLVRDAGAYTLSMWSRHCSRAMPPVIGVERDGLRLLREAETAADLVDFWSRTPGSRARRSLSAA